MRRVRWFLGATAMLAAAACGGQAPSEPAAPAQSAAPAAPAAPAAYVAKPHANLAEIMRAIPFPASNIIFDAQTRDPGAPQKEGSRETTTEKFASLYGGWQQVELSAIALMETATLASMPGRLCENGNPAPIERADYQKGIAGLVEAGQAALKAAKAKNLDQIVDASGLVAEACSACHGIYRDTDIPGPGQRPRCTPPPAQ